MLACVCSYQGSTAEQDHKDDEGFKPVVFYNQVTRLSQKPPVLPPAMCDGNVTAFVFGHTFCMTNKNTPAGIHQKHRWIILPMAIILCFTWYALFHPILISSCSLQLWTTKIMNTTYHLSSKGLGQCTPPQPQPLPPPPHQAWCLLCCPQTNWCHPARTNRRPKRSSQPLNFSLNIMGSAVRCWKHMDRAQSQYNHYINVPLGSCAWHDLLLEVYMLQSCSGASSTSASDYPAVINRYSQHSYWTWPVYDYTSTDVHCDTCINIDFSGMKD